MKTTNVFDADAARQRALEAIVLNIINAPEERVPGSAQRQEEERARVIGAFIADVGARLTRIGRTIASLWRGRGRALPESLARSRDRMIHASRL